MNSGVVLSSGKWYGAPSDDHKCRRIFMVQIFQHFTNPSLQIAGVTDNGAVTTDKDNLLSQNEIANFGSYFFACSSALNALNSVISSCHWAGVRNSRRSKSRL